MSEPLIRSLITISIVLMVWQLTLFPTVSQDQMSHPILKLVQDQWLHTPKSEQERKTRATVLGTTCNAVELDDAYVEPISHPPYFLLEYSKSVDITENSDACLDLTVPDIDTKFELTFAVSTDPDKISFEGQVQPNCKDCKPKKAKSISGTLRAKGGNRYQISFAGDLSADLILEPLH
jgi:hypothetical protein